MVPNQKPRREQSVSTLKRSTFAIGAAVIFTFCMIIGITGGAMGFGSLYPPLNYIAKPFVCPGKNMSYSRHRTSVGSDTYYTAEWFCTDHETGEQTEISSNLIFLVSGPFYGLIFFLISIIIVIRYWNSDVGPTKNGGPKLW